MNESNPMLLMLADSALPWRHRCGMLRELVNSEDAQALAITKAILDSLGKASTQAVYEEKLKQLEAIWAEMQEGPMRSAIFLEMLHADRSLVPVALVALDDGTQAYVVAADADRVRALRRGDRVMLDGKGRALLRHAAKLLKNGLVAHFERRIDDWHIEISLRAGADRMVFVATQDLMDQIDRDQVRPGSALIVSERCSLAIAAIPAENGLSHYRFLDRGPVPSICVERDIGAPSPCIEEVSNHVRTEFAHAPLRRRYRLRRCLTKLLCGVSGSGKTLTIAAIQRRIYEIISEFTGVTIEQLPPRVFRIRMSQILSMWLGESEKNWQRAVDEALQLADEVFTTPDGRQFKLPVLIILEEVDGMGRARGQEAIHDRILTTVLQSLDPGRVELSDRLVIVLATTNEPHLVDPALLRRVGGSIEHFGRLKRRAFMAVLEKLTNDLPAACNNGYTQREIWDRHIQTLGAWFFSPNGSDPGLVELTYAGSTSTVIKYRRDFLTGGVVDRAVQQAATEAVQAELAGCPQPGVTLEQLARAFDAQLRGIVDQLKEHNVGSYTDLPDGVRVASLRRIPQSAHLSFEFIRS